MFQKHVSQNGERGSSKGGRICPSEAGTEIDGFSMLHHRCVLQFFHEQRQICGVCEEEFVPDFLSSSSVLVAGVFSFFFAGWMEGALMWQSQCCDRTPKRNQMLFGLDCGAEV